MFAALFAAAALQFSEHDADIALETARSLVERHPVRDSGTPDGRAAARFLRDAAVAAGARARLDGFSAPALGSVRRFVNVFADFPCTDPSAGWIVFVSHFDTKPGAGCPGANDGASTSGLLVALSGALSRAGRTGRANVTLVWTDGEECVESYSADDGLWGARRAAERLAASGRKIVAVICLDMLGDADLCITLPRNATPEVSDAVLAAAKRAGLGDTVRASQDLVKDDHVPFLERGFPAVDLIDFQYGSAPGLNDWWHTPQDTPDKISAASLLKAGRLAAELVSALAAGPAPDGRAAPARRPPRGPYGRRIKISFSPLARMRTEF